MGETGGFARFTRSTASRYFLENHLSEMIQIQGRLWNRRLVYTLIIALGLLLAAGLGAAAARLGENGGTVLLGVVALPVVGLLLFTNPGLGLYSITLTLPIEELIPGIGGATGTRLLGMVVFAVWLGRKLFLLESWRPILRQPVILAGAAFLVLIFASNLWADDASLVLVGLFSQVQLFFLLVMAYDLTRSWKQADLLARLLLISGLIACFFTLNQYFIEGAKRAGDGIAGGINYTASFLVTILPLAFYLLRSRRGSWLKFFSLLYIVLGTVAVTVTFSRTSYIFLALTVAAHYGQTIRARSGRAWIVVLTLLAVALPFFLPGEAVSTRLQSISPVVSQWLGSLEGNREVNDVRAYSWRVGLEMFRRDPLFGAGYNNYGTLFLTYQVDLPGSPQIFTDPRSPHSSFIGIASELGLAGILLWVALLGIAFRGLLRAGRALKQAGEYDRYFLVQAIGFMLLLQVLYGWALNTHMNKNFWLILGMAAVLSNLSRASAGEEAEAVE